MSPSTLIAWLEAHRDATVIVFDTLTNLPVYAEYQYANGVARSYPACFYFFDYMP